MKPRHDIVPNKLPSEGYDMNTDDPNAPQNPDPGANKARGPGDAGAYSQQFQHRQVAARVPERVGRGVMSTGVLVLDGPNEFILDFLQGLTRPYHIAARVVLAPAVMAEFINTLHTNIARYTETFGPPPAIPRPPTPQRPSIQEIYETFKLPDELLSGAYANSVLIGHSAAEFFLDFITSFYPTAAVSCRVYLAAPQAPRVLETLTLAMQQYQQRRNRPNPPPPPGPPA